MRNCAVNWCDKLYFLHLLSLLMTFVRRKLHHAANAPSQLLRNNSYPRTGTLSVVSWTLAVKCSADGDRLEDCSTRLARERQNCGLRSLSSYVEQWVEQQSAGDTDRRVMTLARNTRFIHKFYEAEFQYSIKLQLFDDWIIFN